MITENESVKLIFGLKIRSLRQQKGLSYQQLSELTKVAISYLHDIENGKKYPKADKILTLAKALGVDYDYLVSLTGDKKLQPLIDLISTDFINVIPWEHFGLQPAGILELFTNTPDKITTFISTLVKISRAYHLSRDNFYTTALRSYQDMYNNYFEDLEAASGEFRETLELNGTDALRADRLETLLETHFAIRTDRRKMGTISSIAHLRSYFAKEKKVLYLNKQLSPAQEAFLLARELGFQVLGTGLRPYETMVQHASSFDLLLNNFKASYFAASLLIPEADLAEDVKEISSHIKWDGKAWLALLDAYNVTPEMLMQRLTNILPHHFGIDQLFFLRMSSDTEQHYEITKELHLSQLHNPHANLSNEHYCRRWMAVSLMEQGAALQHQKKLKGPLIGVQISHYWQTQNRYLCITIAKPKSKQSEEMISVTLGLMLDKPMLQLMRFVNDPHIHTRIVNTTCERCSINDCKERAAPPLFIQQQEQEAEMQTGLEQLNK
jgi:transcriptional regulator with XRE-family HTH domain/predicted transcriptional regulator